VSFDSAPARDIDRVATEFRTTGFVVLEGAIPCERIEEMYRVWLDYFEAFRALRPTQKRFLMHLPFKWPLYEPRFVEHPVVLQLVDRVLGTDCLCGYFGSETPIPGAEYMEPHFDLAFVKRLRALNAPLSFVNRLLGSLQYYYGVHVSLPLVDSLAHNAPFEIWPASNRLGRRQKPECLLLRAGSLLVRDVRNVHRGTPHRGHEPRPFVSLVYLRSWVPGWKAPEIPIDVYRTLPSRSQRLFRHADIGQPVPAPNVWAKRSR
jgi:hypothetical protein